MTTTQRTERVCCKSCSATLAVRDLVDGTVKIQQGRNGHSYRIEGRVKDVKCAVCGTVTEFDK